MRNLSSTWQGKEREVGMKKGPWTPEEDQLLSAYINQEGEGQWRTLPQKAGLLRCGKSCRLRWMNYLRPSVKRGHISPDEEDLILRLHRLLGNRWSLIAGRIPGRTDNEIKNYWNTHLSKKLISQGIDPTTHTPLPSSSIIISTTQSPLHYSTTKLTSIFSTDNHNKKNKNNHHDNHNFYAAPASSRLHDPLDNRLNRITTTTTTTTAAAVSPAQSDKNDQEYYYGGMKQENDQFDASSTGAGKAKGHLNNDNENDADDDDDDAFFSSLVNYEQLYHQPT